MKRLFLFTALLSFALSFAQSSNHPDESPDIDTLTIDFVVLNINGNKAQIMTSRFAKKYEVSVTPEINPFGYELAVDREYTIALERDKNLVYQYQTRGQTRTLPARMIWFAPSELQLKRDKMLMQRLTSPGDNASNRSGD